MRLLGGRVGLGVARAHRQATKAEAAQQLADTSLVQFDIELSRDLLPKVNNTPANHAVGLEDRPRSYPLGQRRFLLLRELARRTAAVRAVGQAGHAFGIVMMPLRWPSSGCAAGTFGQLRPVAQRLTVHPAIPRRHLAALAFHHKRQRQHPSRGSCVSAPSRLPPQVSRRVLQSRDRHRHRALLHNEEGKSRPAEPGQLTFESNQGPAGIRGASRSCPRIFLR